MTKPINDPKAKDYISRVAVFTLSNIKRKGYSKEQITKLMATPDFMEKCMKAYNESFEKWCNDPKTRETLSEMVYTKLRNK